METTTTGEDYSIYLPPEVVRRILQHKIVSECMDYLDSSKTDKHRINQWLSLHKSSGFWVMEVTGAPDVIKILQQAQKLALRLSDLTDSLGSIRTHVNPRDSETFSLVIERLGFHSHIPRSLVQWFTDGWRPRMHLPSSVLQQFAHQVMY